MFIQFLNEIIPVPRDKVKSYTFTGSVYREHHTMINSHAQQAGIKIIVQDPMFLFPNEIEASFIPHAVDTDQLRPVPVEQKNPKSIGCYTPHHHNTTARKDIQLLESLLESKYPGWRTTMGTNCVWNERMEQLSRCMFFMQNMDTDVAIFGRSALEASAMGIPAFSYISPKVLEMSQGKIGHPAIIQTRRETLPEILNETLNSDYSILSQKARDWAVKYYSYPVIGEQYSKFFDKLLHSNQMADKNTAIKMTLKTTQPFQKELSAQTPATNRISNIKSQKIGRNDLCSCGSGKKYKKCCLNKAVKQK